MKKTQKKQPTKQPTKQLRIKRPFKSIMSGYIYCSGAELAQLYRDGWTLVSCMISTTEVTKP